MVKRKKFLEKEEENASKENVKIFMLKYGPLYFVRLPWVSSFPPIIFEWSWRTYPYTFSSKGSLRNFWKWKHGRNFFFDEQHPCFKQKTWYVLLIFERRNFNWSDVKYCNVWMLFSSKERSFLKSKKKMLPKKVCNINTLNHGHLPCFASISYNFRFIFTLFLQKKVYVCSDALI